MSEIQDSFHWFNCQLSLRRSVDESWTQNFFSSPPWSEKLSFLLIFLSNLIYNFVFRWVENEKIRERVQRRFNGEKKIKERTEKIDNKKRFCLVRLQTKGARSSGKIKNSIQLSLLERLLLFCVWLNFNAFQPPSQLSIWEIDSIYQR